MLYKKGKQENAYLAEFLWLILGLLNLISFSGFAGTIHLTEWLTFGAFFILFFFLFHSSRERIGRKYDILTPGWFVITLIISVVFFLLICVDFHHIYQFTNYITIFGAVCWVKLFSKIHWARLSFYRMAMLFLIISLFLMYLITPGHLLSGWNPNSPILIMPMLFGGMSMMACSDSAKKRWWMLIFVMGAIYLLLILENRSSLLGLLLFLSVFFYKRIYLERFMFRILYMTVLALNVVIPYYNETISRLNIYAMIVKDSQRFVDKNEGFHGREEDWGSAIALISRHDFWGSLGQRGAYPHNFSLDIIYQFGWLGYVIYLILIIAILEKSFRVKSKYNIFLIVFVCLLVVNGFESALFANNALCLFPYTVIAISYYYNHRMSSSHFEKRKK